MPMACPKCGCTTLTPELTEATLTVSCFLCGWLGTYIALNPLCVCPGSGNNPEPEYQISTYNCQNCETTFESEVYKKWCTYCRGKIRKVQLKEGIFRF